MVGDKAWGSKKNFVVSLHLLVDVVSSYETQNLSCLSCCSLIVGLYILVRNILSILVGNQNPGVVNTVGVCVEGCVGVCVEGVCVCGGCVWRGVCGGGVEGVCVCGGCVCVGVCVEGVCVCVGVEGCVWRGVCGGGVWRGVYGGVCVCGGGVCVWRGDDTMAVVSLLNNN